MKNGHRTMITVRNEVEGSPEELKAGEALIKEEERRLASLRPDQIDALIDMSFPYRKADGSPEYRAHQKETITKAIMAMRDGKRFVLIDGPVGCGKSAINYTIGSVCGSSFYLTSQKQLQDQIAREHWKNVKMVKGKGAYSCNFVSATQDVVRCDYNGDRFSMCNNATFSKKKPVDFSTYADNVRKMLDRFGSDERMRRMKTAFECEDDVPRTIGMVKDFIRSMLPLNAGPDKARDVFQSRMCCQCNADLECPAKSSRFLAKMFGIKVLNPDVLYALQNYGQSRFFPGAEVMVIDECHSIESFISRIFEVSIPVGILHKMFGVPMNSLLVKSSTALISAYPKFYADVILPTIAIGRVLSDMRDMINVDSFMDVMASKFKDSWAYRPLMDDMRAGNNAGGEGGLSTLGIIVKAIRGDSVPEYPNFAHAVSVKYSEYIAGPDNADKRFYFDMDKWMINGAIKYFEVCGGIRKNDNIKNVDTYHSRHIVALAEMLEAMGKGIEKIISVTNKIGDREYPAFITTVDEECFFKTSCEGVDGLDYLASKYFGPSCKDKVTNVMLTPVAISSFLHKFFFSNANHVILSSGTWVNLDSARITYGIRESDSEYIRIPTTFPRSNRPVFVISSRDRTNFSDKNDKGEFIYKTKAGTQKFCDELYEVLETARARIRDKLGTNPNAIVHCHTFDLSRRIAENMKGVDGRYLMHIGPNDREITNIHTGHITVPKHKDDLVQQFMDRPDSGLTMVSASISEGVDFKDDIARIQVLLKKPIPYLGDPYVKSRFQGCADVGIVRDPMFMDRIIFTDTIQQYGRIVRTPKDWGITIVFDQAMAKTLWYMLRPGGSTNLNVDYFLQGIRGGVKNGKVYFDDL